MSRAGTDKINIGIRHDTLNVAHDLDAVTAHSLCPSLVAPLEHRVNNKFVRHGPHARVMQERQRRTCTQDGDSDGCHDAEQG